MNIKYGVNGLKFAKKPLKTTPNSIATGNVRDLIISVISQYLFAVAKVTY